MMLTSQYAETGEMLEEVQERPTAVIFMLSIDISIVLMSMSLVADISFELEPIMLLV